MENSVFLSAGGDRFIATELARGPWDPNAQHGGAPAALLMRAFELIPHDPDLTVARITYEFVRPVPLGELEVSVKLVRPGRRVQLLEGSLRTNVGVEVVRARALRVARSGLPGQQRQGPVPPGPEHGRENDYEPAGQQMFATDAMEIRFVAGAFYEPGPATAWFRLRHPLLDGETVSPLQSLAAAGDFGNGISAVVSWDDHVFINPDLTLYFEREPTGEWICLESSTRIAEDGIGLSESVLYDRSGRVGRAMQALLIARR